MTKSSVVASPKGVTLLVKMKKGEEEMRDEKMGSKAGGRARNKQQRLDDMG
jgi:hypothetical protein